MTLEALALVSFSGTDSGCKLGGRLAAAPVHRRRDQETTEQRNDPKNSQSAPQ